jgi:trigger factor
LAPEFEVKISKHDKVPFYKIEPNEDLVNHQVESYQRRMGEFVDVEQVSEKEEMLKADLKELDDEGNIKEGGLVKEDISLSLSVIKDEEIKNKFQDTKPGDELDIDLKKAYPSEAELSSMLNIEKEELGNINNNFRIKINEVKKFEKAEINQELFDKIYGEGEVTSEEEFNEKVKEELREQLKPESERKLAEDVKNHFVRKVDPKIPSDFLKRWLKESQQNQELTEEQIEKEFPLFEKDVKWDLIKNKILKDNEIKVEQSEVEELAKQLTKQQFQQYGIMNFPEEQLEQYAKQLLQKEEERNKLYERKREEKIVEHIKENIKLEEKEVSFEEFQKQVEEDQNKQSK